MKRVDVMLRISLHAYSVLSLLTVLSVAEECVKQDSCSCKTSSRTINLHTLSSKTGTPRFQVKDGTTTTYYYNPCQQVSVGGVTADVIQLQGPSYYNLGLDASAAFSGDPALNNLKLTYTSGGQQNRKSIFSLTCECGKNELVFVNESPTLTYNFILKTELLCTGCSQSSGLSTGSILVILFFVFLAVYLIAGILFLKFVRRAEGVEMVPNYEFWKALPSLIRDGCYFTFRGCKSESTYEKI